MKNGLHIEDGDKVWYKDGKIHREDGPAIEYSNGTKGWSKNGQLHRGNGPAVEYSDGDKEWYYEDQLIMETKGDVTDSQIKEFKLKILS